MNYQNFCWCVFTVFLLLVPPDDHGWYLGLHCFSPDDLDWRQGLYSFPENSKSVFSGISSFLFLTMGCFFLACVEVLIHFKDGRSLSKCTCGVLLVKCLVLALKQPIVWLINSDGFYLYETWLNCHIGKFLNNYEERKTGVIDSKYPLLWFYASLPAHHFVMLHYLWNLTPWFKPGLMGLSDTALVNLFVFIGHIGDEI